MSTGRAVSSRIGDVAASLGWDRNNLLPSVDLTVPEALCAIAGQIPTQTAIESPDEHVTYADVVARANQIAHALLDREPDPTVPVVVLCGHGATPPIAICGVLHAGLLSTPLDAREPADRLQRMVAASDAQLVIADREHAEIAIHLFGRDRVVLLDTIDGYGTDAPSVEIPEEHPGLVLFTSGSTGAPKGVVGGHRDIVPRSVRRGARAGTRLGERQSFLSSFGFTAAENAVFGAFVNGATLCTYDLRTRGTRDLPGWVRDEQIEAISFVPSTLRGLAEVVPAGTMDCVRTVNFGGEALFFDDVRVARPLFGPETVLRNGLGSTESGGLAAYDIRRDTDGTHGPVPAGTVAADVEVRIVDEDDVPVQDGEVGRLVIVRWGVVALGYWRDAELTRRHFFREPDGRRGFRTPDAGRLRDDGMVQHVARMDSRVKVHGAMVATSEVEVALLSLPDVADGAVIAVPGSDGGTRLVAYVVARGDAAQSAWKLRRDLAEGLSSTSVPSAFVAVDTLPRTVRGKVDRAALPVPPEIIRHEYRAPSGREMEVADLFGEILGADDVGADDDFFELGGDSLAAVELLAAIEDQYAVTIGESELLGAPTPALLAPRLSRRRPRGAPLAVRLRDGKGDAPPFFCIPGGGSPALAMRWLSDTLEGRTVYALQARGIEERGLPDRSVEAIARRDVAAMRAVQPAGPYLLGGYSFGALVAFEMACQLQAAGADVGLVVLIDTPAPGVHRAPRERLARRADRLTAGAPAQGAARTVGIATSTLRWVARSAREHAARRVDFMTAGLVARSGLEQYHVFYRLSVQLARRYRPTATFHGHTLVVRAADGEYASSPDLGWTPHVDGTLEIANTPGTHHSLRRRPDVETLGARLLRAFDDVD